MNRELVVEYEPITALKLTVILAGLSILSGCGRSQEAQEQLAFQPLVAQEEFVIDGYDAVLVPINLLEVSPDDRIFVVQLQESSIRVFDADGADLLRIGGRGEGPGEFRAIYRMGFLHDTLWVLDNRIGRVSLYSPNLDLVRTEVRPPSGFASLQSGSEMIEFVARFFALLPDGSWNSRLDVPAVPGRSVDRSLVTRGNVNADGTVLRVVASFPAGRSIEYRRNGAVAGATLPFAIDPFYRVGPGGTRSGLLTVSVEGENAGTIQVTMWDFLGDTIYSRRYPIETEPLPEAVANDSVEARASMLEISVPGRGVLTPGFSALYRREAWTPPVYPPVEEFLVGRDGSAWIRLRNSGDSASVYRILDPSGEPYGEVHFPRDVSIEAADLNSAWGVFADELDVQSVVKYTISGGREEG